jgi:kynurenine formamidase
MKLLAALLVASLGALLQPAVQSSHAPRNEAEFDQLFQQVSNWGRWGKTDQLGSVNLVTPEKRKAALALATAGTTVSLSHDLLTERADDNNNPFEQTMLRGNNMDRYAVTYHGYAHSHIDALCHILYKDRTYNGYARAVVNTDAGCAQLGIDNLKNGVITRGVLVDMAALKGVDYLEPGAAIYPQDLDAWEQKTGITIGSGDAVLVRTGRWARRAKIGPWNVGQSAAGLHASVAAWFKSRDIALLGSDAGEDVTPSQVEGISLPVHVLFIAGMGVNLLDNQDLEALASVANKLHRWTFTLTLAPLAVHGGTGSPANVLATF